jgi:hypothetical protein
MMRVVSMMVMVRIDKGFQVPGHGQVRSSTGSSTALVLRQQ